MKILRGPHTTGFWTTTDEKAASTYSDTWKPGRPISFDATIDKQGDRHTKVGVELNEDDVLALHRELIKHFQQCVRERDEFSKTIEKLETVLQKISALVSYKREKAPNSEAILDAISEVADHFFYSSTRNEPFKTSMTWLEWEEL